MVKDSTLTQKARQKRKGTGVTQMNATTTQRTERRQGRELIRKVMLCILAAAMATMMLAPATAWATEAVTTDSTDSTINTDNPAPENTTPEDQGGGGAH
jgi:hypothetical protein